MIAGKIILLVEDDAYQVLFMEIEFQRVHTNAQLHFVKDGIEAQQYVAGEGDYWDRQKHPLPEVILLDLQMPRLDGFGFLNWLRSRPEGPERFIPVIVMSGSADPEQVARAELGANGYLIKEVDWDKFRKQVRGLGAFYAETPRIYST